MERQHRKEEGLEERGGEEEGGGAGKSTARPRPERARGPPSEAEGEADASPPGGPGPPRDRCYLCLSASVSSETFSARTVLTLSSGILIS